MGTKIKDFEDLRVWQEAMLLVEAVYGLCATLPKEETYGLASQLKRCAVSVPSNIAEGSARQTTKELIQFLYIAHGSLAELRTQLLLAQRLGFAPADEDLLGGCKRLSFSIKKLITVLRKP